MKLGSILMLVTMVMALMVACGGDDSNSGNDNNTADIGKYVGKWSCIYPTTYGSSIILSEGTTLVITTSGSMTWTMLTAPYIKPVCEFSVMAGVTSPITARSIGLKYMSRAMS